MRSGIRICKNIIAGIKDNQYWEQIYANKAYILVHFMSQQIHMIYIFPLIKHD